jgi:NADH-quinone oxidoreductase subunit F
MGFQKTREKAITTWKANQRSEKTRILIGMATCGKAAGGEDILKVLQEEVKKANIQTDIIQVGCIGLCYAEPLIEVIKPGMPSIFYGNCTPERISEIVKNYLIRDNPCSQFALGTRGAGTLEEIPQLFDLPVLRRQVRISLRNCGNIDPENIEHYIANGGYSGLFWALSMSPQEVIDEIKKSGLRGRGGAGFPTGLKWQFCYDVPGSEKYIVCNADEGDPGAFMDRALLESDPHAVLEGMLIAAYAIGASKGYIYTRAEYPLAIQRLQIALNQMKMVELLGKNIMSSGFCFDIQIKEGAGAFVCGEETALIASIQGKRGMPRSRPPFPAQSGLWGKPTNINNVETLATVSAILQKGSAWFAHYGTEKSKGTKTFSLAGKVVNTGLIEVPMGTSLREIVYDIGGGIPNGKRFKAVQTGGPSGGCLPAQLLDLAIEYESLAEAGSIIGSGGMIVMDEDTCMVDSAKFFLSFVQDESCGKCIPCRWGTRQMLEVLEDITNGRGKIEDIDLLMELSEGIKAGSLCGMGQTAPNPVLSTLRYFRDEYVSHIKRQHCPAAVCKGIVEAPCSHTCPANVDVPRYIRCIGEGKYYEAVMVIRESIPFPSVCGHVCFHPCESKCRRALVDAPIAIKELKRFATDYANNIIPRIQKLTKPTGKQVAIVGSGPSGLTAAYYLAKLCGHSVTVFEALSKAGGMLRFGIPRYRLPEDILDKEIDAIERVGVKVKTNTKINSINALREQGYDALYIAIGAQAGLKLGIPGEDSSGVIDGITFLRRISISNHRLSGERTIVIGGGNTAIDSSRSAIRLGAKEVTILYRRSREEMPASDEEIEGALSEGIKIQFLVSPVEIVQRDGHLSLKCLRMKLGHSDESGRKRPEPVEKSEFDLDCDTIITAIGQKPDKPVDFGIESNRWGLLFANTDTLETNIKGVFAGGDAVSGPSSVIEAIAAGKYAAIEIDKYLGGRGTIEEKLALPENKAELLPPEQEEGEKYRPEIKKLSLYDRLRSFDQVELGLVEEQAIQEANRCLQCDLESYHEVGKLERAGEH